MATTIPASHEDLLTTDVFVTLATVQPDGQPQCTVVWIDYDGENVLVNTARGRQKDRNLDRRTMATVLAVDPEDPWRWLEVRGQVVESTEEGAVAHIHELARRYTDQDSYYGGFRPAELAQKETRVIYKIKPTRVNAR